MFYCPDQDAIEHIAVQSGIWLPLSYCRNFSRWFSSNIAIAFSLESCRFGLNQSGGWQGLEITVSNILTSSPLMMTPRSLRACWISRLTALETMTGWFREQCGMTRTL